MTEKLGKDYLSHLLEIAKKWAWIENGLIRICGPHMSIKCFCELLNPCDLIPPIHLYIHLMIKPYPYSSSPLLATRFDHTYPLHLYFIIKPYLYSYHPLPNTLCYTTSSFPCHLLFVIYESIIASCTLPMPSLHL